MSIIRRYRDGALVSEMTMDEDVANLLHLLHRPGQQRESSATWQALHQYTPTGNASVDAAWLEDFSRRVPGTGCRCRHWWREWVEGHPADWSSAAAWFAWTVAAHNAVNSRIGKPILTVDEASLVWAVDKSGA